MEKNTIIAIALGILVLVSVVQAVQVNGMRNKISGNAVEDTEDSYDKMMAEMHPELYSNARDSSQPSGPVMVGGC